MPILKVETHNKNNVQGYPPSTFNKNNVMAFIVDPMPRNFIWGGDTNKRSLNLVNWEVLTRNKKVGGVGICDTRSANISLLGGKCQLRLSMEYVTLLLKIFFTSLEIVGTQLYFAIV
ncbi:hypothetical protein Lal_00026512 [Lupinus albus]|nr:hypothetical protein Lal_00026512 [Lupinus albus]